MLMHVDTDVIQIRKTLCLKKYSSEEIVFHGRLEPLTGSEVYRIKFLVH